MKDPGAFVVAAAPLILVGLVVLVLNDRARRRREGPAKAADPARTPTPPWLWLLVVVGIAVIVFNTSGGPRGRAPAGGGSAYLWLLLALPPALIVLAIAAIYFRQYDRVAARALKRFREGDQEGAIAELREQIEERGPTARRLNALGLLYHMQKRWPQAYEQFLKAEEISRPEATHWSNQGIALMEMGRLGEAADLLGRACQADPNQAVFAGNHAVILARLGLADEAARELERAETLSRQSYYLLRSHRRQVEEFLADCRRRVAEAAAKDSAGFEEL